MYSAEQVPGDPGYVRKLSRGELPLPSLVSARARWEARQAAIINSTPARARMLLGIIEQFVSEVGEERARQWTLVQVRDAVDKMSRDIRI